jgi:thioredoxin 1
MFTARLVTAACIGLIVSVSCALAEPEVFSDAGFPTDQTFAVENDKLHVIYFTASWCPPCQKMKTTTWVDESLVSWLDENAIVTAVDVDEEPQIAAEYNVSAMPTMVVLEAGSELGRVVGYRDAVELKGFMERAASGELAEESAAGAIENAWRSEVDDELEKALEHLKIGEMEEAGVIYAELFQRSWERERSVVDPSTHPRMSTLVIPMVVKQDDDLRQALEKERDRRLGLLREGSVTLELLGDWAMLNCAIGDEAGTIAWAERNSQVAAELSFYSPMRYFVEEALENESRLDLLAEMIDPLFRANNAFSMANMDRTSEFIQSMDNDFQERRRESFIEEMARYYTIALLQDDEQSAGLIAEKMLGIHDDDDAHEALKAAAARAKAE